MQVNGIRTRLNEGKVAAGVFSPLGHPTLVEVAAAAGYDFFVLDGEHGALPPEACEAAFLAARGVGITPLVRVRRNDPSLIGQYLDTGALGVVVPRVSTPAEARRAAAAARYFPAGERGIGPCRANGFALSVGMAEYIAAANREVMVLVQAEDPGAVSQITEIVGVPGVDGIVIGPRDLSTSMGYAGNTEHPKVREAIDQVMAAARAAGLPVALPAGSAATIVGVVNMGARIVFGSLVALLHSAMTAQLAFRKEAGSAG